MGLVDCCYKKPVFLLNAIDPNFRFGSGCHIYPLTTCFGVEYDCIECIADATNNNLYSICLNTLFIEFETIEKMYIVD